MSALWTSDAIAEAVEGSASAAFECTGVEFDSREVAAGDLFFALKGETSDGHKYVAKAFEAGAAGAVVSEAVEMPHILVGDTTAALEALAKAARSRGQAKIVGVTGSVGKTGTKEALFLALDRSSRGKAHRSLKSYNNHVGVPLSLTRMPADTAYGVFEMGMNHPGELSALTRIVRPDVAIVTTIAPAHREFFSSEEEIADAKAEIFEGLVEGGTAIIPADNPHYERLRKVAEKHAGRIVTFGFDDGADACALDAVPAPGGGSLVTARIGEAFLCYTVAQPGQHWIANSLAVLAAVEAVGGDLASAGLALAELPGLAGRGARHSIEVEGGKALLIDESYNANPASMAATIGQLGLESAERRIAILGSMKELGSESARYHRALAGPLADAGVALAILVGDDMEFLAEALEKGVEGPTEFTHAPDAEKALERLRAEIRAGDAILVKGSNAVGLSLIVDTLAGGGD